jgi:hypothetical protein
MNRGRKRGRATHRVRSDLPLEGEVGAPQAAGSEPQQRRNAGGVAPPPPRTAPGCRAPPFRGGSSRVQVVGVPQISPKAGRDRIGHLTGRHSRAQFWGMNPRDFIAGLGSAAAQGGDTAAGRRPRQRAHAQGHWHHETERLRDRTARTTIALPSGLAASII